MKKRISDTWTNDKYSIYERNAPTFENTKSLAIYSDGTPVDSYTFEGNCYQASTPTPTVPVEIEEFGDLITSGDNAGLYDVPITSAEQTVHLILSEPLRKIGDYADSVDSEGVVTRKIKKYEITGQEDWQWNNGTAYLYAADALISADALCTHFSNVSVDSDSNISIPASTFPSLSDFKTYLAQQYDNGTPVTVYHVLATPTTESYSKNLFTPATAQTITLNGVTCVSDGQGRYSLSGTSSARAKFELNVPEFTVPASVGNGGTGTWSIFNDFTQQYISVQLYNGSTRVTEWSCNTQNRTSTTYSEMSNKTLNKIVINVSDGVAISGTAHLSPMITNDSTLPSSYEPYRTVPAIPTTSGNSTITIGTSLAPSKVELDMGKMFVPKVEKVRVNGAWT